MTDNGITLGQAIEEFLQGTSTVVGARMELFRFATLRGKDCPLFVLTPSEIKECVMEVKKAADRRKRAEALEVFFDFAKEKGWVMSNLAIGIIKKKESKIKPKSSTPKREQVILSSEGRQEIEAEVKELLTRKQMVIAEVAAAREEGDLKENAGYHDARERLAMIEAQLRTKTDILTRAAPLE